MIGMEKPAAMLYASSAQKPLVQVMIYLCWNCKWIDMYIICHTRKIYSEFTISCYASVILHIAYNTWGLQFVLDEAHCIVSYEGFR